MVCLGCLESKYFPRDLIFGVSKNATEPSGTRFSCSRLCETKYVPGTFIHLHVRRSCIIGSGKLYMYLYIHVPYVHTCSVSGVKSGKSTHENVSKPLI